MSAGIQVLGLPALDIERGRMELTLAEGSTVGEIVDSLFPDLSAERYGLLRVTIGEWAIHRHMWLSVKPKPGLPVVVRIVPQGSGGLRSILSVVVSIASIAAGQFYLGPLLASATGLSGATAAAISTAAVAFAGNLLLNALIPIKPPDNNRDPSYSINGWKNALNPNGTLPAIVGKHRVAPPWGAFPFTETIGDDRYITGVIAMYGPLELSDFRIGDDVILQDLGSYAELSDFVQLETRAGYASDAPLTLYPTQVIEDQVGQELVNEADSTPGDPVKRTAAADAEELSVDFQFPGGLFYVNDKGDNKSAKVVIEIRARLAGTDAWTLVTTLTVSENKQKAFWRSHRWMPPVRGRYEVQCLRANNQNTKGSDRVDWICLRAHRPEYPFNFDKPLALVCARVKASKLTNGTLDSLNFVAQSICADWDAASGTWVMRATVNPASHYRRALQGVENPFPKADSELDLPQIQDWHEWCARKNLTYSRAHDFDASLEEALADICRAGRATPQNVGTKWGVCIDRPRTAVSVHIGPRNSWNFSGSVAYGDLPDAFRIKFRDQTNDYEEAERVVPRPGLIGDPQKTEELSQEGITDPDQVYVYGRRRFRELMYRRETWTCQQDVESLIGIRGDLVLLSHFREQVAGRVAAIDEFGSIVLDETVEMEDGVDYVCRFRLDDGSSLLRGVMPRVGETNLIQLRDASTMPAPGDLFFFGRVGAESFEAIIKDVENGEDMSAQLTMIAHAPQIDAETDADAIPAWDGRVGFEVEDSTVAPAVPVISRIDSGSDAEQSGGVGYPPVFVYLQPGDLKVPVTAYEVQHRLQGTVTYTAVQTTAGNGYVSLPGYYKGAVIELIAEAIGRGSPPLASPFSSIVTHTVGANDPAPLAQPTLPQVAVAGLNVTVSWLNPNDPLVYSSSLWRAAEGAPFTSAVQVGGSPIYHPIDTPVATDTPGYGRFQYWITVTDKVGFAQSVPLALALVEIVGPELIADGAFASGTTYWTAGTGWTVSGGVATKAAGSAGNLSQVAISGIGAGGVYRLVYTVRAYTAGGINGRLSGGTAANFSARNAAGTYTETLTALAGNTGFQFVCGSASALTIDNVSLKRVG